MFILTRIGVHINQNAQHGTINHKFVDMASQITLMSFEQLYRALNQKGLIGRIAEQDAVYNIVCKHDPKGIIWRELHNGLKNVQPFKSYPSAGKADKIKDVLKSMTDAGMLRVQQVETATRPTLRYYAS